MKTASLDRPAAWCPGEDRVETKGVRSWLQWFCSFMLSLVPGTADHTDTADAAHSSLLSQLRSLYYLVLRTAQWSLLRLCRGIHPSDHQLPLYLRFLFHPPLAETATGHQGDLALLLLAEICHCASSRCRYRTACSPLGCGGWRFSASVYRLDIDPAG